MNDKDDSDDDHNDNGDNDGNDDNDDDDGDGTTMSCRAMCCFGWLGTQGVEHKNETRGTNEQAENNSKINEKASVSGNGSCSQLLLLLLLCSRFHFALQFACYAVVGLTMILKNMLRICLAL